MSDKSAQYVKLLKNNIDKIVIAVAWLIVAGLGYVLFQEQTSAMTLVGGEGKPADLSDPIVKNPQWEKFASMTTKPDITSKPEIAQVAQYNMFDYKAVRNKEEIEKGADQKYARAEELAKQGQKDEAKRILQEILVQVPAHKKARELMNQLNGTGAGSAPTPATQ